MKKIILSFLLACPLGFILSAQTNDPALKLAGIIDLPGFKRALLEVNTPNRPPWMNQMTLGEGERDGKVEVLTINARAGVVTVATDEGRTSLKFEEDQTEIAGSAIRLDKANLQQVLDLYALIKERTVLQHPSLKLTPVSLVAVAQTKSQAAAAIEESFQKEGIVVISDGEKFVMVVPTALTNSVAPRSNKIVSAVLGDLSSQTNNEVLPAGTINLRVDLEQVIPIYGALIQRQQASGSKFSHGFITLKTVNPLSKAEAIYVLETLFAWNGLKVVPEDDKTFRVESISQR